MSILSCATLLEWFFKPENSVVASSFASQVVDFSAVTVVAGEVGEDRVLELVRPDRRRVLPGTQVETLLTFSAYLKTSLI
jgi:hypothetical protein